MKTKNQNTAIKSFAVLLTLIALCFASYAATPGAEFKVLKQKNGINLYYRWMKMPDGNKVRQMKAVLYINGSFVIRELPDGHSILECYFLSKKASAVPRWITDPIITGSILGVLEGMRNELQSM